MTFARLSIACAVGLGDDPADAGALADEVSLELGNAGEHRESVA